MNTKTLVKNYKDKKTKETINNLNKREFEASYFETVKEAVAQIMTLIPQGSTVGFGGSVSTRESGLIQLLRDRGDTVYDHWEGKDRNEKTEIARKHFTCDVYVSGTNAISKKGQLVNLDGTGNRVSALSFGPKKVIVMVGINKITEDLEGAIWRTKNYAAPINYERINPKNNPPCQKTGSCADCIPPQRQCRVLSIIEGKPRGINEFHIFIIGEELGY